MLDAGRDAPGGRIGSFFLRIASTRTTISLTLPLLRQLRRCAFGKKLHNHLGSVVWLNDSKGQGKCISTGSTESKSSSVEQKWQPLQSPRGQSLNRCAR